MHQLSTRLAYALPLHSVRAYLLALLLAVALPLSALALVQTAQDAQRQRRQVEAGLRHTARSLALAVERELQASVSALTMLGFSTALQMGDLAAFYEEARRVCAHQRWFSVWLVDAQGRHLLNLQRPYGTELPALGDRDYVRQALATGAPAVSGLLWGRLSAQPMATVAVPIVQRGLTRFVLVAGLRPAALAELIQADSEVPAAATVSLVDGDYRVIARSRDMDRWVGQRATDAYIDIVSQSAEGMGRSTLLEGQASYVAFRRLAPGGWTLGVGTPANAVDAPLARDAALTLCVGAAVLLGALAAARLLYRCLALPLAQLSACARDIAEDRLPHGLPAMPLTEFMDLRLALERAGQALDERRRLARRERELARELAAAEDHERQQIARDLHDELAQTLAALQIRLASLCRQPDEAVARAARLLGALAARAERFTRSLSAQIAPPALHELGLQPALAWLADEMERQFGLCVHFDSPPPAKPLPPEVRSIVYRATRELLINVAKHARCDAAELALHCDAGVLCLSVRDHGAGLRAAAYGGDAGGVDKDGLGGNGDAVLRGTGLRSVRERLSHIGGRLELRDAPGGGTLAQLWVPLAAQPGEEGAA
jgi:signal transduction histidine kinase